MPVARIVPKRPVAGQRKLTPAQAAILADMLDQLPNTNWEPIEHIGREQLYDEETEIGPS